MKLVAPGGTRIECAHGGDVTAAKHPEARDARLVGATLHIDDDVSLHRVGPDPAPDVLDECHGVEEALCFRPPRGGTVLQRVHRVVGAGVTGQPGNVNHEGEHYQREPSRARRHPCEE